MVQHIQRFETSMFEYCADQADRTYKLLEDRDWTNGMQYLAHLADVLQLLVEAKNGQGVVNVNVFAKSVQDLDELNREAIFAHFQENGFGQYIPE
jgi:hypothetical protein